MSKEEFLKSNGFIQIIDDKYSYIRQYGDDLMYYTKEYIDMSTIEELDTQHKKWLGLTKRVNEEIENGKKVDAYIEILVPIIVSIITSIISSLILLRWWL